MLKKIFFSHHVQFVESTFPWSSHPLTSSFAHVSWNVASNYATHFTLQVPSPARRPSHSPVPSPSSNVDTVISSPPRRESPQGSSDPLLSSPPCQTFFHIQKGPTHNHPMTTLSQNKFTSLNKHSPQQNIPLIHQLSHHVLHKLLKILNAEQQCQKNLMLLLEMVHRNLSLFNSI